MTKPNPISVAIKQHEKEARDFRQERLTSMSYRGFHVLEDKPHSLTLELRETWIDPDKDIWRWKMYVSEPHKPLRVIGSVEGYETLAEVLHCASLEFKHNDERKKRTVQQALYNRTDTEMDSLTPAQRLILKQFEVMYNLVQIDHTKHLPSFVKPVHDYVRRRTQVVCNLRGSNDFSTGCFLYPSGKLVCRCTEEFVIDLLDTSVPKYMLETYYGYLLGMSKVAATRLHHKSPLKGFVTLRTLLKQVREEKRT